ncbi:MAG: class I SAM-dependent methyltransferase [candidate division FCPU426 bacterium]
MAAERKEPSYCRSCHAAFWQGVFQAETAYLERHLRGCRKVLSVGCGPANIEGNLLCAGFDLTGLDVSREALAGAPEGLRTMIGRAEKLPFVENSFDAVVFIASLQFVEDYRQALAEAARVLRPGGKVIALLLNPKSPFYRERRANPNSYVRHIKAAGVEDILAAAEGRFSVQDEYFLGIRGETVYESRDPSEAAIYAIRGIVR